MDVFKRMGERIAARWDAVSRNERRFAEIATSVLTAEAPQLAVALSELSEWVLFGSELPPQWARPFGQPPINLYVGAGFYIEANVWLDGTTTIHQHGFSGAFCMLAGRSLHACYQFVEEERVNAQLRLGRIHLSSAELLGPREVRRIDPGSRLIHAAFHLNRPGLSIVVRSESDAEAGPQLDYLPPAVAIDSRPEREPLRTQLELLAALAATEPARRLAALERLVDSDNRHRVYRVLAQTLARLGPGEAWNAVEAKATRRHPDFAPQVCASLREAARQQSLINLRSTLHGEEERLLLALLANLPDRAAIYRLLQSASGPVAGTSDPAAAEDWILAAIEKLTRSGAVGTPFDPISLAILRCLLRDRSLAETVSCLLQRFPAADLAERQAEVERAYQNLGRSPLLRPLLVPGEAAPSRSLRPQAFQLSKVSQVSSVHEAVDGAES